MDSDIATYPAEYAKLPTAILLDPPSMDRVREFVETSGISRSGWFLIQIAADMPIPDDLPGAAGSTLVDLRPDTPEDRFRRVVREIAKKFKLRVLQTDERSRAQRIESKATAYIKPAIDQLQQRATTNKRIAYTCYALGTMTLGYGTYIAYGFSAKAVGVPLNATTSLVWADMTFNSFRGLVVIALLVAISKYLFNIGKAYMTESLRNSDRAHAIGFGKFFLEAYGTEISPNDVREVFETWNIDTTPVFAALDANDHDPKLFDRAMEMVGKASELVKAAVGEKKAEKGDK